MTLTFSPQVEAKLIAHASHEGIDPSEFVEKLILEYRHSGNFTIDEENQKLINLLQSWRDEDATDDPEELDRRDNENVELMANLQTNRLNFPVTKQ